MPRSGRGIPNAWRLCWRRIPAWRRRETPKAPRECCGPCTCGIPSSCPWSAAADPHAANSYSADGFTPLGLAIFFGHREAARLLLDAGANPRTPSRNALRVAPLHSAVAAGDLEAVRMLIARGAEADPVEFLGATPLHSAAMSGRADIARVLIEAGADPERKTKDQKTALDLAEAGGHAQVAELLRGWRRD